MRNKFLRLFKKIIISIVKVKKYKFWILLLILYLLTVWVAKKISIYRLILSNEYEFFVNLQATEKWYLNGTKGDNIIGYPYLIVPNIVHYVLLGKHQISFVHYISIKSVLKHQKPEKIIFHCDCDEIYGNYWERLNHENNCNTKLIIRKINLPKTIFGQFYNWFFYHYHASDVLRIQALMLYGGIYLDRDVYVVKSLDEFRKYEMTIGMESRNLGNQVQIANKRARFLKLYLLTYQDYHYTQWYYNSGINPTKRIINKYPNLVHKVEYEFGSRLSEAGRVLYQKNWDQWQDYYTFHLFMRENSISHHPHNSWMFDQDLPYPEITKFDENNVKTLKNTFGQMARLVLYNTTEIIND